MHWQDVGLWNPRYQDDMSAGFSFLEILFYTFKR